MAQRPTRLRFHFRSWQDGWYALRLPTRRLEPLVVSEYREEIIEWLFEQDITLNELAYLSNGNTGDGPVVPAASDGFVLCLLFRRPTDVMRFHLAFGVRGLTSDAFYEAVQAEASVHKFVFRDLALIAYDAARSLVLRYDEEFPEWDALEDDEQQFFLQLVREYVEGPERSPQQMHEKWLERRHLEVWGYATEPDLENKRHPWIAPFSKLPEREQDKIRLITGVVRSLAQKLVDRSRAPA